MKNVGDDDEDMTMSPRGVWLDSLSWVRSTRSPPPTPVTPHPPPSPPPPHPTPVNPPPPPPPPHHHHHHPPPPPEDDGTMNGVRIVRFPGGAVLGPFTVTGDFLSDGPSPIHIHWSKWLLALTDTAMAPGLPRWPIPEGVVDHLQRYQVGAANIQSPSLRHDGDRMISASNFRFIYLAIVASVSKNKWHLVANFQPYIFHLLWDSCLVLLSPTWE